MSRVDSSTDPVLIVGEGGHARVVVDAIRAAGGRITGFLDDRESRHGKQLMGSSVIGGTDLLAQSGGHAVIAIGSNAIRARIDREWPGIQWVTVVHPTAWIAPDAELGPGSVVCAGAVIQTGGRIGRHCIVNTGASLDHDGCLGDFSHLGPGARLAGNVTLHEGAFAGVGSSIIPGRRVGAWTTIGAGAAVVRDLPANVIAVGVPAEPIKQLDENWHLEH